MKTTQEIQRKRYIDYPDVPQDFLFELDSHLRVKEVYDFPLNQKWFSEEEIRKASNEMVDGHDKFILLRGLGL